MKKLRILAVILLLSILTNAQNEIFDKWEVGTDKNIGGHLITKKQGDESRGITNISYSTHNQVHDKYAKDAEDQMWSKEKKDKIMNSLDVVARGGIIRIYVERLSIEAANTKNFRLIIKDELGEEICNIDIEEKIASVPSSGSDYWSNLKTINIPKEIKPGKIQVYIIDKMADSEKSKTVFEVKD